MIEPARIVFWIVDIYIVKHEIFIFMKYNGNNCGLSERSRLKIFLSWGNVGQETAAV